MKDKLRQTKTAGRIPPTVRAEIIGQRKMGFSYRQIASSVNRDKNTVMKILNSPEAQQELADSANDVLNQYRQRAQDMVPEALDAMGELIADKDRVAVTKLLFGTQTLTPKTEQLVEKKEPEEFDDYSREELTHYLALGHFPGPQCEGKEEIENQIFDLLEELKSPP